MSTTYGEEVEALIERLPTGSGINCKWERAEDGSKGIEVIGNTFEARDEMGGLCHSYGFHFIASYVKPGEWEFKGLVFPTLEHACCGGGLREYVEEQIRNAMKAPATEGALDICERVMDYACEHGDSDWKVYAGFREARIAIREAKRKTERLEKVLGRIANTDSKSMSSDTQFVEWAQAIARDAVTR